MINVISLNESKTKLRIVHLTLCQSGKYFPKDVINFLSQKGKLQIPITGKIGKFSIVRLTIDSKECLAVNLTEPTFTDCFGGGTFNVTTKPIKPLVKTTEDITTNESDQVVSKIPSLKGSITEPRPERTNPNRPNKRNPTKTKIIPFPTYMAFSHDYSTIIRFNRFQNPTIQLYLSNVG
jgi:hypothetical protein